jgi:hypothetical protein
MERSIEMERAAEWHYDECVRLLIPSLGDNEKVMVDDGMLAATVILRVYEQMNGRYLLNSYPTKPKP